MGRAGATPSLLRNTAAQSAPLLLGYLFSFLAAPVVVSGLGITQFGIWALTGAIAQYVALLDGFGPSLSRFIAAHQDNRRACGEYIAIAIISVTLVSVVALVAAIFGAELLSRTLHGISPADMRVVGVSAAALLFTSSLATV